MVRPGADRNRAPCTGVDSRAPHVNKTEREELRRLLRARFKLLRSDVAAREAELHNELDKQINDRFAAADKEHADRMDQLRAIADEANRAANDIGRDYLGVEKWGARSDAAMVRLISGLPNEAAEKKQAARRSGKLEIEERVRAALLELQRQENDLLTELATSALESAEAKNFFNRIPTVSELVPAYRLKEVGGS